MHPTITDENEEKQFRQCTKQNNLEWKHHPIWAPWLCVAPDHDNHVDQMLIRTLVSQHQSGLVGWLPLRLHSGFSFLSLSLLLSLSSGKDSDLFSNIKESSKKDGPGTSKTRFCVSFVVQACSPSVSDRASKPIKRLRPYLSSRCSLDSIESLLDPESCFFKVCNCRFSLTISVFVHHLLLRVERCSPHSPRSFRRSPSSPPQSSSCP